MSNNEMGNHDPSKLENECYTGSGFNESPKIGPTDINCPNDPSQEIPNFGWSEMDTHGQSANCDPMQSGKIRNDPNDEDPEVIHRFANGIRGTNEAMFDLFRGIEVVDDYGRYHPVPIIWGTQERAVAYVLQDNIDKEKSTTSRLRLPLLAIHYTGIAPDWSRYVYHKHIHWMRSAQNNYKPKFTVAENGHNRGAVLGYTTGIPVNITYRLAAWSMYVTDIEIILSQIINIVGRGTQLKVNGIVPLIDVSIDGFETNINADPGEGSRVITYVANITAKSWIPQPVKRSKTVTKIMVSLADSVEKDKVNDIFSKIITEVEKETDQP